MSYFDDASLVMIPSGYKTSKVYSVKPTDGTGDLAFTRSNDTATRVGPDGLIEKVRTNLALQSQTFNNASWTKYQSSVTANSTTAPDGTLTADTLADTAVNDTHQIEQNIVFPASEVTISIFAKANTLSHIKITAYDGAGYRDSGIFNLSNGTVSGFGSIISAGNGWYRCSYTFSSTGGGGVSYVFTSNGSSTIYAGSGQSIFIWGYQLETGVATPYIATTTAAVSVGPVSGLPRLDYLGSTCPRLLLEPQRTNLALYSEQFDNAGWNKNNLTITANNLVSPDGYTNADTALETATNAFHDLLQSPSLTSGTTYTLSSFVKAAGRDYCYLFLSDGTTPAAVKFNLATGVVLGTALGSPVSSKIENYGNGWYRCSMVYTSGATATGTLAVSATNSPALSLSGYAGDITKGIAVYGAQLEAGAYATSYIPTLGAAVTRGADAASKTSISSLIGQTEGTLFAEVQRLNTGASSGVVPIQLNDGTNNNRAQIEISSTGAALCIVSSGGSVVANITGTTLTIGQTAKIAISYKVNDFKIFVNGVLAGTDTSGAVPVSMSRLDLASEAGISYAGYALSQALHFKTALTPTQLAELTA